MGWPLGGRVADPMWYRLSGVPGMFDGEAEREGPFVIAALLCERVLQESDGSLTAVRTADMLTVTPVGEPIPEGATLVGAAPRLFLLLSFRGGTLGSKHVVTLTGHSPSGATETFPPMEGELTTTVPGAVPGFNFIVQVQAGWQHQGVYWFEVRLDGRRVSVVPLLLVIAPPAPALPLPPEATIEPPDEPPPTA